MILKYIVDEELNGKTILHALKSRMMLSSRLIKRLKYNDRILCNSIHVHSNHIIHSGDMVEAQVDFEESADNILPEKMELKIIFEDEAFIAIDKQPNMVVHPTAGHPCGTVANALAYYLRNKYEFKKIRPVSRLDRDTSGIIIFAKNEYIQEAFIRQMKSTSFIKEYLGLVHGIILSENETIRLPIERKPGSIMLRQVSESGIESITHYEVLERFTAASFVRFILETGRTHQIRVHCQALGHPLIGDTLYPGNNASHLDSLIGRQALHSFSAKFLHPLNGEPMSLTAPIPKDMSSLLEILRK